MRMAGSSGFFWGGGGCCQIQTLDSTDVYVIRLWKIVECYRQGKKYKNLKNEREPINQQNSSHAA
jgi:hypothetical protein